ncbi:MAG: ABC transporter ATP-binding protein [Acidobacteria bacterium]|nr:ABC transporter ATP-binding protein [Acidobacteriota bacterium]
MAIAFKNVVCPPLRAFSAAAPDRATVGIVGEDGAGKGALLRVGSGHITPASGSVSAGKRRRLIGPSDPLNFAPVDVLLLDHAFALHDGGSRARALIALEQLRRAGTTILMVSHEEGWLRQTCDELWWIHDGKLAGRGDPSVVLEAYHRHISERLRSWGELQTPPISTHARRGDSRAEVEGIETLGEGGRPTGIWRSGEPVEVRVTVRFLEAVADPVIGLLIRSRVGLDVYGTNTELEKLKLGPRAAGDTLRISFRFNCELCPQEYTLTVASHDPDGTRHDWLEDAVAVAVTDTRYTAGVANLRAKVTVG